MSGPAHHSGASASDQARQHNGNVFHGPVNITGEPSRPAYDSLPNTDLSFSPLYGRHRPMPKGNLLHQHLIHAAAEGQHPNRLECYFRDGANVDAKDERGLTSLHHACFNGHARVVETLIKEDANPNASEAIFGTPLCLAAVRGHLSIVKALVDSGASFRSPAGLLGSPLHCAAASRSKETFLWILDHGDDSVSFRAVSCINLWATIADDERQWLGSLSLRAPNSDGGLQFMRSSPTAIAILYEAALELTTMCLQAGADVNDPIDVWRQTIDLPGSINNALENSLRHNFTLAMLCGHFGKSHHLEVLLAKGASTQTQDSEGNTAVHYLRRTSSYSPHWETCLSQIIAAGVDVNASNKQGRTALHERAGNASVSEIRALLTANANITKRDRDGRTALSYAVLGNKAHLVPLLSNNININKTDCNGNTALMLACQQGHHECVDALSTWGASPDICNDDGLTALMIAKQKGRKECVRRLLQFYPQLLLDTRNIGGLRGPPIRE